MKELFGSPGKLSGLCLRIGQCLFAAASLGVMASASGFSTATAFWSVYCIFFFVIFYYFGIFCNFIFHHFFGRINIVDVCAVSSSYEGLWVYFAFRQIDICYILDSIYYA